VKPFLLHAALATLFAISLTDRIDSSDPILAEFRPVRGPEPKVQLYASRKGYATEPERADYTWNRELNAHTGGDVHVSTVHPANDYIVQTVQKTEHSLLRKFAKGVYLVVAVDDADANEANRAAYCKYVERSSGRIEAAKHLFAYTLATAARQKDEGSLAIRLSDTANRRASGGSFPRGCRANSDVRAHA
jgi:hypothetical protein